jgi:PAS domain S-box-containing protein
VRYRRLFEAARDGILILDAESGVITDVNPFLIEMLSFSKEEICGKELWELGFFKDIAASRANFQELQQKEYIRYEDLPLETSKGRKFRVEFISNVYRVNHHKVIQCNVRDITERVQAEEKIRQLNAELEQRVEDRTRELREAQEKLVRHEKLVVLGQMSSSVGHELRNPLSVINSAVYYLKMIQPNAADDVKEYLGIIDQEVHTAEKIITDLLDFSRIKSVDREAVSVSELIRRTLERFPVPESVAVTIEVPSDLPQVFVDVHHMTQVLGNLTVNACQAMTSSNERTLIVGQLSLYSTVQNDMINITVKDNGVGISAENMKKIFEPLFTTKTKGIGLGLAVSQKLVAANEGRIEVESEAGKGTSFHVYLPIYGVAPVVARDKKESE